MVTTESSDQQNVGKDLVPGKFRLTEGLRTTKWPYISNFHSDGRDHSRGTEGILEILSYASLSLSLSLCVCVKKEMTRLEAKLDPCSVCVEGVVFGVCVCVVVCLRVPQDGEEH